MFLLNKVIVTCSHGQGKSATVIFVNENEFPAQAFCNCSPIVNHLETLNDLVHPLQYHAIVHYQYKYRITISYWGDGMKLEIYDILTKVSQDFFGSYFGYEDMENIFALM